MKKILLTLILLIPALCASAQGPIKSWNDQLDDFITDFNQIDQALDQLYTDNGLNTYTYTYFEPTSTTYQANTYSLTDSGNVVKETTVFNADAFGNVNDALLAQAKELALESLATSARKNARINSILSEFNKRGTNIVLLYSTDNNGKRETKEIVITPKEIQAAR